MADINPKLAKTKSTATNLLGIQGYITLPSNGYVADNNTDYFNFYFGLGDWAVEGGISYTKKPNSEVSNPGKGYWKLFLNGVSEDYKSDPYNFNFGQKVHLKLFVDSNNYANLYVNRTFWHKARCNYNITDGTYIKMCQGADDASNTVKYSDTTFSGLMYRDKSTNWNDWTSG